MADHYYSKKPSAASDRQAVRTTLRGKAFEFATDAGVFSKEGIDFGSRLLIDTMDISETDEVLDVGCGYGPIGLTAASLASRGRVTMVDINERAVKLAKENAGKNGITNADILQGDLFESLEGKTYTKILTNPPIRAGKQVVHRIFEMAYQHLVEGGQLWIVIQKKQGAPSALAKLESLFGMVDEVAKDKGYRIYCATK
ncbi:class I SAM-dependent methyltransferase [Paenibacillus hemerocallicola]|uniref:Class I SAM-dependent methyltransferase n=1 Tax=Paenibacillus hemerocallicola TaxID=1172614 RepID=A0A5C4T222_9BACL|nr:class I SAM-dependent methyltransferase [Paenibacillus hemerocallicola]TNJ62169.1 class I SAM-dependent methyltransferase [Paenibacillus hemerocallicola]